MKHYVGVEQKTEQKTLRFYVNSDKPREGYEEYDKGEYGIEYRKYFNKGIYGYLKGVQFRETKFGNQVVVVLTNDDDVYYIQVKLSNSKGDNASEVGFSLVSHIPNMAVGTGYRLYPYYMAKGDVVDGEELKYDNIGISVKEADVENQEVTTKVQKAYTYAKRGEQGTDTKLPPLEFKERRGKFTLDLASAQKRLEWLEDKVIELAKEFGYNNDTQTREEPPQKSVEVSADDMDDDLPF